MATLEDKILGEKREYYCSSSESEDEAENSGEEGVKEVIPPAIRAPSPPSAEPGISTNTGPKGVIKDWQKYRQLETEKREEREREKLALIQKLSLTCRSDLDKEKEEDPEFAEFLSDEFLLEYSKQRMQEMLTKTGQQPKFGNVMFLESGQSFLDAIDKENKSVTVIVHIYEEKLPACKIMNECLSELSQDYMDVKFCKILASVAGVSKHFKVSGVPALLVYKNGNLVGNYIKLGEEFGIEFTSSDVESFLIENGMLYDKSCVPGIINQSNLNDDDDDDE